MMMIGVIIGGVVGGLIYQLIKPPTPKICGSPNGPPVTSPRIRLSDGRHLAYKARGVSMENAKHNVIVTHGFCGSKDFYMPLSDEWLQELGICLITFDRPGYAESDPNPKRSPKSDAFDIQELADQLKLGPNVYVVGCSMGSYLAWGCLKYIPHRFSGVALIAPVINYWWPSFPSKLCNNEFRKSTLMEPWRLWIVHHAPKLAWLLQQLFPFPTRDDMKKNKPHAFNESDLMLMEMLSRVPEPDKETVLQQGIYESMHRDVVVSYGAWEFDPLELGNPYPDNSGSVHIWFGGQDGITSVELSRHVAQKLPWIRSHEVPNSGHMMIHDKNVCEMMLKSLVLGEDTLF